MKKLTAYGRNLVAPWEERMYRDIDNDNFIGTRQYDTDEYIHTLQDEAAWCLLTYDAYAIDVVEEWRDLDGCTEAGGFPIEDVLKELSKCIQP